MRLNFNQHSAAHSTSELQITCAKHFVFADPKWIRGEGGATVGFWWVPLRLLDKVFRAHRNSL